jgi:hypothetical protein
MLLIATVVLVSDSLVGYPDLAAVLVASVFVAVGLLRWLYWSRVLGVQGLRGTDSELIATRRGRPVRYVSWVRIRQVQLVEPPLLPEWTRVGPCTLVFIQEDNALAVRSYSGAFATIFTPTSKAKEGLKESLGRICQHRQIALLVGPLE